MIYFDNSATTKVDNDVLNTYQKVSENYWGNPSSLHNFGEKSFNLLQQSRKQIADILNRDFVLSAFRVIITHGICCRARYCIVT